MVTLKSLTSCTPGRWAQGAATDFGQICPEQTTKIFEFLVLYLPDRIADLLTDPALGVPGIQAQHIMDRYNAEGILPSSVSDRVAAACQDMRFYPDLSLALSNWLTDPEIRG